MKNCLRFGASFLLLKTLVPVIAFFFMCIMNSLNAQVNFTQTTDSDFNKGVLSGTVVSGENIYLQNVASDPGLWWTGTVFLPQNLTGHRTVTANNKYVYLVGGFNGSTYSNNVYVATIQTAGISAWTSLNPLPVAVRDAAVVVGTNTIYVIGGRNSTQIFNTIYQAAINTDGSIGAWHASAVQLPEALWGHSAVFVNGYIYVAGGSNVSSANSALSAVYYNKLKADNTLSGFSMGTSLPAARNMHSMVTHNNKIYLIGGYDNGGTKTNTVYFVTPDMDGTTGSWASETDLPVAISNHSAVVSNGLIMVLGGATALTLNSTIYYANLDQSPALSWLASPNSMFDFIKDGSAFAGNNQVIFTGGISQAGNIMSNCRYTTLSLTSNYVNHGTFVSYPFYELGAERLINSLTFTSTYNATYANCQVSYRLAGSDKIWGDWTGLTATSPVTVNQTKQFVQYSVFFTGETTYNVTFSDMTLTTPGTALNGYLNGITTFTAAASPYIVFSDIYFTSGTHTFQAGTTVLFAPGTGMTVGQANIVCSGTTADSVKFMNLGIEKGQWKGIYFDGNSNVGVSSQFFYTVIADAGYSGYNANLYCYFTAQPFLSHCSIRGAEGNGVALQNSDPSFQNTVIKGNTENGIRLDNSNPTVTICNISYNGEAGIYANTNASILNGTTINNNFYGVRYMSPNFSISQPVGSPALTDNTYNGIAMDGGDITTLNKTWNFLPYDYFLLGNVRIWQGSSNVRLTIKPGNRLKFIPGSQLVIGGGGGGGELYALGTSDSLITFTSINGIPGGWNGIYFTDNSDNYGGHSQLTYCVVEKGNEYNIYSEYTIQPDLLNYCTIQNAVVDGARYYQNVTSTIDHTQFLNNGRYPLWFQTTETNPVHTYNTYLGNGFNKIVINGGTYGTNRTLTNDGAPYYVMNDIFVAKHMANSRLTISPGVTLEFAAGKKLQVGQDDCCWAYYGGELYAEGTDNNIILFKPYSDTIGGWGGIYFSNSNDNYGGTSSMKHCKIEKAKDYNLRCESSDQPQLHQCEFINSSGIGIQLSSSSLLIDSCIISNSASHGLMEYSSSARIQNCQFLNNNGYPLKFNDWGCNSYLYKNTYSGNAINFIGISGGGNSEDRTFYNDGIPYHVLGDITNYKGNGHSRITVKPGVTLAFAPNTKLQIGINNQSYGAELYAEGTADSLITFKPFNNSAGGWGGIYFADPDYFGATSSMKHCQIEKAVDYNLRCENSNQPQLHQCVFTQSSGVGIQLYNSSLLIDSCIISNSGSDGIVEQSSSSQIHHCQFLNNNGYPLKYNDWSCNSHLMGNTYLGNAINYIAISGGSNAEDRTFYNDGIPYHILNDITNYKNNGHSRLTIKPGVTMAFAPNTKLQIGINNSSYGADLFAEGTADSLITFKPFNNAIGGWGGIYFADPDYFGGSSSMKHCKVEKAADYNLRCDNSNQPQLHNCEFTQSFGNGLNLNNSPLVIDSCTISNSGAVGINMSQFTGSILNSVISNSGSHGLVAYQSNGPIHNCKFLNNNGYPLKFTDWSCNFNLLGNTFIGNTINYIAIAGGDYYEDRTLYNYGIGYHILGNIRILKAGNHSRLTIKPGLTLAFQPGISLQVGESGYGGELFAEGTADSVITFKPINDSVGGWNGIYFHPYSDEYGSTSSLKYCTIEKSTNYNIYCNSTNQPGIHNCIITHSSGVGMQLFDSSPILDNCIISNSGSHGVVEQSSSALIQHSQFIGNNGYPLKYNDLSCNSYLHGNTYTGNTPNYIAVPGGDYWSGNSTFYNDGIPYHVLDNIRICCSFALSIKPGVTMAFTSGKNLQVGVNNWGCNIGINFEGKPDSLITFTSYNGLTGGWDGIYFSYYSGINGSTSSLKYCKVEKASANNILCESTMQPLMEHCELAHAGGNGLKLSNSTIVIRNSSFVNNTLNGILLEGNSNPAIGNNAAYSCNLFYNGAYNVSNMTSNNINAHYNFWASRDSIKIKAHIFDKSDSPELGFVFIRPFIDLPHLLSDSMSVSGFAKYANTASSTLNNSKMKLLHLGNPIDSTTTNGSGHFSFDPIQSGGYNLTITPTQSWGGVNATDALLILNHTVHLTMLTGIKLAAADLNKSNTVNSTDALFAMNRFTGIISSFPSGDSFMDIDTMIVDTSHVTNNLKMLWFGDVNGSYIPTSKTSSASVSLAGEGYIVVPSFMEFNLPVKIRKGAEVGAISFGFYFPEDLFEITGVTMTENRKNFIYSAKDGLFRFAWSDLNPVNPNDDEMIVMVKMRSKDLSGLKDDFTFRLYEDCEFADRLAQMIPDVVLDIPGIKSNTYGFDDPDMHSSVKVHPNPFSDYTTIDFSLTVESSVAIELCDLYGKKAKVLESIDYSAGNHQVLIKRDNLIPGIYILKVDFATKGKVSSKIIKVMVSK